MTDVLQVENVFWRREGKEVLSDVSWRVQKGEHWALLGLNGSGKTTLLNMVNGYLWPTAGTVQVLGQEYGAVKVSEVRKQIGWVSSSLQERLYGESSAEEIVISGKYASIGLYDEVTAADMERAVSLVELLGCAHLRGRSYGTCSQGEKQKLLIARALMADPQLLVLDEPCSGLDIFSRQSLLDSIQQLASLPDGPTLIYVTHHVEEITPVFSHALLLRRGEVFGSGRADELLTDGQLSAFFERSVQVEQRGSIKLVHIVC
ncbi:ABC transporter ATP-binding protein [Ectobacillus ponti]|uniref:ABC transporter ATP-binding protein n=1 Tax=Ectobacillus ponti TaxID=2961894 RepID=A0AA41XCF8_9BACI|nr:ABC transporter ATP-binding protein [Ectobacillus ponti]MCP8970328.1 ABC transporter ATP-binding protein [Ectobacillus ponti]